MITDFVVLGAGIFGLSTAIELRRAGNTVKVVNPAHGNDPQAASNDISKIIRMEYGSDLFYMRAADKCIDIWHDWNIEHGSPLYREVGFLLLCTQPMEDSSQVFEWASFKNLLSIGRTPVRLNSNDIKTRFPAFNSNYYCDGFFHSKAGYADAGLTLDFLRNKALSLGVEFADGLRVESLTLDNTKVTGVRCQNNVVLNGGHVVVCAGANSQHLIPGIGELLRPTGHPVFHLKPEQHDRQFLPDKFPVFAADISNSGWYGFPMHPNAQVVKVANHGKGLQENLPEKYAPLGAHEEAPLRDFVKRSIPLLSSANLVYTRRCFYSDTFDGHFLIDRHPDFHNLTIGTGGSGHGFKMGPLVGKWIRDAAFGQVDCVPDRFKWRQVDHSKSNLEEARNA